MITVLRRALLLLTLFLFTLHPLTHAADSPHPHIIFILADDLGPGDLGCFGGDPQLTPHIDRLAKEGTRFTQFYSASPVCSPSRTGFLTGMFPARWQITNYLQTRQGNRSSEQADFLDPHAPSIARQLQAAGYATAHFGKWHLGGGRDVLNAPKISTYGFGESASTWESPDPHPAIESTPNNPTPKIKRWDRTAFFVDQTLDFLRRNHSQPCFIQLWPDDVHTPWVPEGRLAKGDTPANFQPVIREMDRQLGRLFAGLKDLGIDQSTLIVFASDNGPSPTFNGTRSAGLRGAKWSLYEAGIHLPCIVRWPSHTPANQTDNTTVLSAIDFFPTLCSIAGAPLPKDVILDGQDLSTALLGHPTPRKSPLFWEYGRNPHNFLYPSGKDRSPSLATRDGHWKVLINPDSTGLELYDLSTDPAETHDLSQEKPQLANQLASTLLLWWKSLPTLPPIP